MRFFYDSEFLERGPGHPLVLISLGVVAEDGRELYLLNRDFDPATANAFVRQHVLPLLPPPANPAWKTRDEIASTLRAFVGSATPEWWGYCAAYDHVLLCQLFGDMDGLPVGWPYFTHELAQLLETAGGPQLPARGDDEHHALADARWIRATWQALLRGSS